MIKLIVFVHITFTTLFTTAIVIFTVSFLYQTYFITKNL